MDVKLSFKVVENDIKNKTSCKGGFFIFNFGKKKGMKH